MDRQELLVNLEVGRERLEAALARIDPMRIMEPGLHDSWSVKDLLAHLGWWEQRVVDIYDALLHNRTSDPALAETPIDELNRQALAENALRSWDEVQDNEKNSYHALVTLAETAPEADLFDPHRFAETEESHLLTGSSRTPAGIMMNICLFYSRGSIKQASNSFYSRQFHCNGSVGEGRPHPDCDD